MNESTTLYARKGPTELVHLLNLQARDGGYVVNFAHGPRFVKLRTETATQTPLPYDRAKQIYAALLARKRAQGYFVESHSYPEERRNPAGQSGSLHPIRPLVIDMARAGRLISDRDWWLQELYSGQHVLIRKTEKGIDGIDEHGALVALPNAIANAAGKIRFRWVMQGVCIGNTFTVFDMPQFEMLNFHSLAYSVRMAAMKNILDDLGQHFRIAETAVAFSDKVQLLQRLKSDTKRGIVLRKVNGVSWRGGFAVDGYLLECSFDRVPSHATPSNASSMPLKSQPRKVAA